MARTKAEPPGRNSLVDTVVERIRSIIDREKLAAGDRLPPEAELVSRLHVSRPALREAICRLETMGLVTIRRGLGTFVADRDSLANCVNLVRSAMAISPKELLQFAEFRRLIEVHSARRAAELATPGDIAELDSLCTQMDHEFADRMRSIRVDFQFHRKLVEIAGNELMRNVFEVIQEFVMAGMLQTTPHPRNKDRSQALHRNIFDAVRSHDPAAAEEAMRVHMDSVDLALRRPSQPVSVEPELPVNT